MRSQLTDKEQTLTRIRELDHQRQAKFQELEKELEQARSQLEAAGTQAALAEANKNLAQQVKLLKLELGQVQSNFSTAQQHTQHWNNRAIAAERKLYRIESAVSQVQLAKRFGVHQSSISKQHNKENFSDWAREKDPQGIGWEHDPDYQLYYQVT